MTFDGTNLSLATTLLATTVNEKLTTINAATGVTAHNYSLGAIFNHTNIAGNITVNVTNLTLASNNATSLNIVINQGSPAYTVSALQIGGVGQTINWQAGTAPSGNASKKDIFAFTIYNIGGTYTVLGQLVTFG